MLSSSDFGKMAHFLKVPITAFSPNIHPSSQIGALLIATRGLDVEDLEEVRLYALFRRAPIKISKVRNTYPNERNRSARLTVYVTNCVKNVIGCVNLVKPQWPLSKPRYYCENFTTTAFVFPIRRRR
jgi:hypothetical protein